MNMSQAVYEDLANDCAELLDEDLDISVLNATIGKGIIYALLSVAQAINSNHFEESKPKPTFTTADILTTFTRG